MMAKTQVSDFDCVNLEVKGSLSPPIPRATVAWRRFVASRGGSHVASCQFRGSYDLLPHPNILLQPNRQRQLFEPRNHRIHRRDGRSDQTIQ